MLVPLPVYPLTDSPEIKALHPEKYTLHATSHQSLYKYPQLWTSTELCVYLWHKSCSDVIIARRQETSSLVIGTISFLPGGLAHRRDSIHLLNWHVIKVSIFYINFSFYIVFSSKQLHFQVVVFFFSGKRETYIFSLTEEKDVYFYHLKDKKMNLFIFFQLDAIGCLSIPRSKI